MKGLTKEEHERTGERLKAIRHELMALGQLLSERYGKNRKVTLKARAARLRIDSLKCELDNRCFDDLGEEATTQIYYGGSPPKGS